MLSAVIVPVQTPPVLGRALEAQAADSLAASPWRGRAEGRGPGAGGLDDYP